MNKKIIDKLNFLSEFNNYNGFKKSDIYLKYYIFFLIHFFILNKLNYVFKNQILNKKLIQN